MTSADVSAQSTESSVRWAGNEYSALATNSGTEVFLYNVGTGRFLIHGGDWGIQARLFYEDTGKILTIKKGSSNNIIFVTGQSTGTAQVLGANVPRVTSEGGWGAGKIENEDDNSFTILMDGNETYTNKGGISGYRNWHFVRVEDPSNTETYTYYMYETLNNKDYYMGAVYGTNGTSGTGTVGHDGDAIGDLVSLSSSWDKATWTTYNPTGTDVCTWTAVKADALNGWSVGESVQTSMQSTIKIFNEDTEVKIQDLYKWRIVTKEQLLASMGETSVNDGLSTNLSYLINDRGFERNDWSFFATTSGSTADAWNVGRFTDVEYSSDDYRYKYTWGFSTATYSNSSNSWSKTQHQSGTTTEPWNAPVRLKAQWDGLISAKYGFLEFEGAGTVSTRIKAPKTGYYKISCYGFYQGSNVGYLFASTTNPQTTQTQTGVASSTLTNKTELEEVSGSPFRNADKDEEAQVKEAGKIFINNYADKPKYYREVIIQANEGDYIYLGLAKMGANQSNRDSWSGSYNNPTNYYHDTDWVGADQFDIAYLGADEPVIFDEDKEDLTYLGTDKTYTNQALRLKRTMVKDAWNSFVFPLNMNAVQVRTAFGTGARLAELVSLGREEDGEITKSGYYINFNTVALPAEGTAITAGKLYLVMPENEPTTASATNDYPEGYSYYPMGNGSFKTSDLQNVAIQDVPDVTGKHENVAKSKGTYVATTGYDSYYTGSNNGKIDDPTTVDNGVYVPKSYEREGITYGSYVLGRSKDGTTTAMYRLKSDMATKGFRGWIEDVALGSSAKVAFNGVFDDDETTNIEGTIVASARNRDNRIYSISGQLVSSEENAINTLPKGMYIMNGKKFVIK